MAEEGGAACECSSKTDFVENLGIARVTEMKVIVAIVRSCKVMWLALYVAEEEGHDVG
jgi:hypothetical protein